MVCVNSGLYTFDNFGRTTTSPSWGSASSGPAWTPGSGSSGGSSYVSGGYGTLQNGAGPSVSVESQETDFGILAGADFLTTISLRVSSDSNVLDATFEFDDFIFGWAADDGVAVPGHPYLFVQNTGFPQTVAQFSDTFWSTLGPFAQAIIRAERVGNILRMKLWNPFAVPEPGWMINGTKIVVSGGVDQVKSTMNHTGTAGTQKVQIAGINISWSDCEPCGCVPWDGVGYPRSNQPINDEVLGTGDGANKTFYTDHPYTPQALEVEVDGDGVEFAPTNYRTGRLDTVTAPGIGTTVVASYLRAP